MVWRQGIRALSITEPIWSEDRPQGESQLRTQPTGSKAGGMVQGLGGLGGGTLADHTHCLSISCCSWRILLDSIASRFCIRSSCRCSSRCRTSASRSRSVINSSRPLWGENRPFAQSPGSLEVQSQSFGGPRCGLSSHHYGPPCQACGCCSL